MLSGWCGWSLVLQQAGGPRWVGLLWCFLPSLLWLVLVELSAAQLDEVCQTGSASHWLAGWWLRLRLGDMAGWLTCLVPIFLLAAAADLAGWLADWLEIDSTGVSLAVGAGLLLTIPLVLPAAMTRWSSGRPLPERLQARLTAICERVGVKGVVAVWIPSGNRWRGAAIVGWLPRFRRLWLGDGLISSLDSRQLDMVLLHELAHVKRRHFLWRVLPLGWSLAAGGLVWCLGDQLGWAESAGLQFAAALISGLVLLVGLGAMARRCELDADWIACDLAVRGTDWSCDVSPAQVLSSALGRLCDRRPSRHLVASQFSAAAGPFGQMAVGCLRVGSAGRGIRAPLDQLSAAVADGSIVTDVTARAAVAQWDEFFAPLLNGSKSVTDRCVGRERTTLASSEGQLIRGSLPVSLVESATPAELLHRVDSAIKRNPHLAGHQVFCQEESGIVVLHGRVSSFFQKQMAQEALKRLEGVEKIINQLEVDWRSSVSC